METACVSVFVAVFEVVLSALLNKLCHYTWLDKSFCFLTNVSFFRKINNKHFLFDIVY